MRAHFYNTNPPLVKDPPPILEVIVTGDSLPQLFSWYGAYPKTVSLTHVYTCTSTVCCTCGFCSVQPGFVQVVSPQFTSWMCVPR